jgi:hypothetical protein
MLDIQGITMKRYLLAASVITVLFSGSIMAKELPYIYRGARPLGMGGAFVALSDDANALFYNPAGLANIKEGRITPVSLQIEVGEGAYKYYKDALDVDLKNDQEVASFLRKHIGDYEHISASFFPSYSRPNFAFGIIGSAKSNFQARNRQYPTLIVDTIEDVGAGAGYAHSLFNENLLFGASVKYLYRRSNENEYSIADITTDDFKDRFKDDFTHGSGILLDLGVIYKFKDLALGGKNLNLQAGLSANNLIGNKLGDAENLDPHVDAGLSSRVDQFTFAADYVDIFGELGEDTDVGKRIHFGIEYAATGTLTLRAGIYQGYPTFGVSLGTWFAQFDVLTYAEEVGTFSGQEKDRRYLLNMAVGF